jgi:hypothetical protein
VGKTARGWEIEEDKGGQEAKDPEQVGLRGRGGNEEVSFGKAQALRLLTLYAW